MGNRNGEALALNDIGRAYADMGNRKRRWSIYDQALPIWRETGNRRGEAMTLNNIGRDYSDLGEPDKALEFDYQALSIWREVEDRRGEALALMTIGWAYSRTKAAAEGAGKFAGGIVFGKGRGRSGHRGRD